MTCTATEKDAATAPARADRLGAGPGARRRGPLASGQRTARRHPAQPAGRGLAGPRLRGRALRLRAQVFRQGGQA